MGIFSITFLFKNIFANTVVAGSSHSERGMTINDQSPHRSYEEDISASGGGGGGGICVAVTRLLLLGL